jgi:thiamine biosynthesis lipoprotein
MTIPRTIVFVALASLISGCVTRPLKRFEFAEVHMGVQVRLTVYALKEQQARNACTVAFSEVARVDETFSDYRADSEAMRVSRAAPGTPTPASFEMMFLLERAADVSARSGGAFDVTVGPCVQIWRAARKSGTLPTTRQIENARQSVGWKFARVNWKGRTVTLLRPDMLLDFGGIAKGYAGDKAIDTLRRAGINRAMFEAGGDIVCGDPPPGKTGWTIKIGNPASGAPDQVQITNSAISTSGDTAQFVEIDGRRYSHVIDPRTGQALTNRIAATVLAPDGMTSDALSTACCVLAPDEAAELARQYPAVTAYVRRVN